MKNVKGYFDVSHSSVFLLFPANRKKNTHKPDKMAIPPHDITLLLSPVFGEDVPMEDFVIMFVVV